MMQSNRNSSRLYVMLCGTVIVLSLVALMGLIALAIVRNITPDLPDVGNDGTSDSTGTTTPAATTTPPADPPVSATPDALLGETGDMGQAYLDSIVFVGDSTTAHLRSRGVLSGGTDTKQVWVPSDNTLLLDLNITAKKIVYPDTGEQLTIAEAAAKAKPAYMVLTIGLNGITSFVNNKNMYQN